MVKRLLFLIASLPGLAWGATNVYPASDNASMTNAASSWVYNGAASAFDCINDDIAAYDDDSTYISRVFNAALVGNPGVKFSSVTDPGTDNGWTVQFRVKASGIGTQNIVLELYQGDPASGGSGLESKTQSVTTSYVTVQWSLASASIAAVTDFTDLYMRITTSGSSGQTCRLTGLALIVPAANTVKPHLVPMTGAGLTARLFGFR